MTTAASSTGRTILTALRQFATKIEPTQAEQKAQANFRRMTAVQWVQYLDRLLKPKRYKPGEGIVRGVLYARLINSLTANSTNDARTDRTKHDRPTKRTGAGNATKAIPDRDANSATPDGGHKSSSIIVRALAQMAERHEAQKKAKEEAKKNRPWPWRNVPQYYAARKERLKHRPAKAQDDNVRAYRLRLIQESQHVLQPPATPMRQSTECIRFKEGHEVQEFDLGQPATSITKWVDGKAELSLTAAEKRFVHEDDWHEVKPNSRHSAKVTRPTIQQVREAIQRNRAVHEKQQGE